MPFAPILQRSIPFAFDRRVGGRDLRERNDFDGLDSRDEDGNVLEIEDDFDVARLGKLFTVSLDAPEETRARTLLAGPDEGQKLLR